MSRQPASAAASGSCAVVLPVPVRHVGVSGRRRGVGDAGGGNHTRGERRGPRPSPAGSATRARAPPRSHRAAASRTNADVAHAGLLPGHDGRHGAGAVGHLGIRVVGLHQRDVGKALEAQGVAFSRQAVLLAGENARGGDGADPHAVAEKQDDVACTRRRAGCCRCLIGGTAANNRQQRRETTPAHTRRHVSALACRMVTNSSAAVGCIPTVRSKCALVAPAVMATAMP